jgi:hypothetical protein
MLPFGCRWTEKFLLCRVRSFASSGVWRRGQKRFRIDVRHDSIIHSSGNLIGNSAINICPAEYCCFLCLLKHIHDLTDHVPGAVLRPLLLVSVDFAFKRLKIL